MTVTVTARRHNRRLTTQSARCKLRPGGVRFYPFLGLSSLAEDLGASCDASFGRSEASLNSRCIRSTIVASARLDLSRSAFPNLTPLIAQFASKRALGVSRRTITSTKAAQSGSALFTASAIADCKWAFETDLRLSDLIQRHTKTMHPETFFVLKTNL
jgi:hypothetical protein